MHSGPIKSRRLSVDSMSNRINILNNHQYGVFLPDNQSISQRELIEIVLTMIPLYWIKSMAIAGLEPREKTHEELIERLEKIEMSIIEAPVKKTQLRLLFLRQILRSPEKRITMTRRSDATISQGPQEISPMRSSGF